MVLVREQIAKIKGSVRRASRCRVRFLTLWHKTPHSVVWEIPRNGVGDLTPT